MTILNESSNIKKIEKQATIQRTKTKDANIIENANPESPDMFVDSDSNDEADRILSKTEQKPKKERTSKTEANHKLTPNNPKKQK